MLSNKPIPNETSKNGSDTPTVLQCDKPELRATILGVFDEYERAYRKLELLSHELERSPRLTYNAEVVYNLLNLWSPYLASYRNAPAEIIQERLTAMRLVYHYLEQLVASNPLLLPDGYQITNEGNYLRLINAQKMGMARMQNDSMAPMLPKDTLVFWSMLKRNEWQWFNGVVSISLYSDFDQFLYGRIANRTERTFELVRENPAYPPLLMEWSDVVHMVDYGFIVGAQIQ